MAILIREGSIEEAVSVSRQIPELKAPYPPHVYEKRLLDTPHLILIALADLQLVGFKVGYERERAFYSWMGGVIPAYRQQGIALSLAETQERWAKQQGYESIFFKTRNTHRAMLIFALKNGFQIIDFEKKDLETDNRIWLRKVL
ncbi:MAG TPA: GNAT family N-acetyltransferase [Saprospiraceae bacterium]|nr:GNAT family N-acetyltransferase [Saprospiraceae bacterium]HMQ81537.1 GNAT family N-acetyltransferase [Saprospiraceae bacterium]